MGILLVILTTVFSLLLSWAIFDRLLSNHTICKNYPIIGRFRFWLEAIGPEIRQYFIQSNNAEKPFSRNQRSWIYATAKKENNNSGFGSDYDLEQAAGHLIIKHSSFPKSHTAKGTAGGAPKYFIPVAKVLGGWRRREKAFRPKSAIFVSGMSYGALSGAAVEALNFGCELAGALHDTGEGGISKYHDGGAELIYEIGTGYFGCRNPDGSFSLERFLQTISMSKVVAIEIKLSQGAKPGKGGILPGVKVTADIAAARGVQIGMDCISPASHSAFHDVSSMIQFIELLAEKSGLPVGIKSAVGQLDFWVELADKMKSTGLGPDFITIDGGEGGTGAAPVHFTDHVSLPFKLGFSRVYRVFAERGMTDNVVWVGSGKLGLPEQALFAFALGCDMIAVAREAMLSIGCIQAQRCHTGICPSGVATQNKWLMAGLDPSLKGPRCANYLVGLRMAILELTHACGKSHPALITLDDFEVLSESFGHRPAREIFEYKSDWGQPKLLNEAQLSNLVSAQD